MFESKLNRGRANGYAPLDGSGKVPLDRLPPIQSTIDTGSFVTNGQTGSFIINEQTASFATTSSLQTLIDVTSSFATTGSNEFSGSQVIAGSLTVTSTVINNSNLQLTGSDLIIDGGDISLSGSLFISGATEFGGNLVPKTARGATLGTLERPFSEIFVSSGSINIASDIIGDPNTTLTNVGGNIVISAGGVRLVGDASFIAATGSFSFISGSMRQIGNYSQNGDYTLVGNKTITGSLSVTGDITGKINATNGVISSSAQITSFGFISSSQIINTSSFATTGSNTLIGNQTITGSLSISSSLEISNGFYVDGNKQFNYASFSDLTIQSASANIAYPMKLNTTDLAEGFSVVSGSRVTAVNSGTYNLQFSAQFEQTTNNAAEISIWLRKNGTNVPNTNTELTIEKISGGGKLVAAWNHIIQLQPTEYVELMWASTRSDTLLHFHNVQSTPTRPATPSVILTMTQIA